MLYFFVAVIYKHYQYLTGIQMPLGTKVGPGLTFPHFSCIIINPQAKIGDYCTIMHDVTIGSERGVNGGIPIIGNHVVISCGAKIIGNVKVGDNVMIGAGAIVVRDIPSNSVAVGNPARVVSDKGKIHTDCYL